MKNRKLNDRKPVATSVLDVVAMLTSNVAIEEYLAAAMETGDMQYYATAKKNAARARDLLEHRSAPDA